MEYKLSSQHSNRWLFCGDLFVGNSILFHELVEYVDELSTDDQEMLFDLIRKRRIEKRRAEIAENAA